MYSTGIQIDGIVDERFLVMPDEQSPKLDTALLFVLAKYA
jgi:hypothetical protein